MPHYRPFLNGPSITPYIDMAYHTTRACKDDDNNMNVVVELVMNWVAVKRMDGEIIDTT